MKTKFYFLLVVALITTVTSSKSQILTGSDAVGLYGKTYQTYVSDTMVINPGYFENTNFWDFSPAVIYDTNFIEIIDPSTTPYAGSVTESNLCFHSGDHYYYYYLDENKYEFQAEYDGNIFFEGDGMDQELLFTFPYSSGMSHSDYFTSEYELGTTFYRVGNVDVEAGVAGTLVLADGTIENVLKLHLHETYYDSMAYIGMNAYYETDTYLWYQQGDYLPLVNYTKRTNLSLQTSTYSVYFQHNPIVTSISKLPALSTSIYLYPNPSKGHTNLHVFSESGSEPVNLNLIDASGNIVSHYDSFIHQGKNSIPLDFSGQKEGIYLLIVRTKTKLTTHKIILL
jgi:hypothetical protein